MQTNRISPLVSFVLALVLFACNVSTPEPTPLPPTDTPIPPTPTITLTSTNTPRPTPTPRPTRTPNLAATQRYEELNAEAQGYFDKGYLTTTKGKFTEYDDFSYDWAQLGWYRWRRLDEKASDFYLSAHFKWSSAYRNANSSGCGFVFSIQENNDHYAVFLDRSEIIFLITDRSVGFSREVRETRGTGRVKFNNPADQPVEADFTLIVKGAYAYVLVDGEVVGEYTLSQSRILNGGLGLTVLSGTNKDFGTRCEMTNIRLWIPE